LSGNLKFSSSVVNIDQRTGLGTSLRKDRIGLLASLEWTVVGSLAILVVLGLALRLNQLDAIGFAEDEMNKLDAVRSYEAGDFSTNAEHPMVMKALMLVSTRLAPTNSTEVALRLPNVLFGALTVVPLFLLCAAFFDRWTALLAAAFWAFGINAITHNRIGKEDTLLVFFMLFAFYFFLRAKQTSPVHTTVRHRNYFVSAIAFGLMIASKYFPHYLGLNMLFHHSFRVRKSVRGEPSGKTPGWFFLMIMAVFLLANPAVLLPHVWQYLDAYLGEQLLTHSGYLFADRLYKNNMSSSPFWGTPLYFYALFLAIKVPLLIVGSFVLGLIVAIVRRRHPGHIFLIFMFLFWIVPYSLIGGKWLRYTLSLMPIVYMLAAVGVVALTRAAIARFPNWRRASVTLSAIAVMIFVGVPAITVVAHGPHYALYTNVLAADKAGYYFPHDEFYDDGLREGIKYVCDVAPSGATIAHETPAVARYYLTRFGRTDINSRAISAPDFNPTTTSGTVYVIVQRGRTYFENRDEVAAVRSTFKKIHEVKIDGLAAVEIFVNH
jgi:Dolichyl-phosphate-mannose-protein mannosyltransferase